ncbi:MAG TPA: sigma 54-interacting transcriptional regulator [Myxococcota bacterium]|nr:sigma 54-interacting transcriptional regulator [Myxococcota bacterium]
MTTRPVTHPFWAVQTLEGGRLQCTGGPEAGARWELSGARVAIGSASDDEVRLPPGSCAEHHVVLEATDQGVSIRAAPGQSIRICGADVGEAWLSPHTAFVVGSCRLVFESQAVVRVLDGLNKERANGLCARSDAMREVFDALGRVAPTPLPVLVSGETGSGKERVAEALHSLSLRRRRVVFDCASAQPSLAASALFGHVAGAFSGAHRDRAGAFEQAHGGTLQLANIDELPRSLQPMLLRVLDDRTFLPVGGNDRQRADVRLVTTSRHDLRKLVADGAFREDLYFRLSVVELVVPSLRARADDLPLLVEDLLAELGCPGEPSLEIQGALALWSWPGNVRELRNVLARAVALSDGGALCLDDLPAALCEDLDPLAAPLSTLPWREARRWLTDAFERRRLVALLERCNGNVAAVAREAGLAEGTVFRMLRRHGLGRSG